MLDSYGNEVCLFPMETANIIQGDMEGTHAGTYAVDLAGRDSGIDYLYAPCTVEVVAIDAKEGSGNALFVQTVKDVHRACDADNATGPVTMLLVHNDSVEFQIGDIIEQGSYLYKEGNCGHSYGNHCHFEISTYPFDHMYDQNEQGVYHLPNNVPFEYVTFMNDTELIRAAGEFKYF